MDDFINNTIKTLGDSGKVWLDKLAEIIDLVSQKWHLTNVLAVSNVNTCVKLIIGAIWYLEDNGDPSTNIFIAEQIFPLVIESQLRQDFEQRFVDS